MDAGGAALNKARCRQCDEFTIQNLTCNFGYTGINKIFFRVKRKIFWLDDVRFEKQAKENPHITSKTGETSSKKVFQR